MNDVDERPRFLTDLGLELARVARAEAAQARHARRPRRARTMALAVAATLALAGAAGAATGLVAFPELIHPGGAPPQGAPAFAPAEATGSFDPALVRELAVLRRERTAADGMGDAARYVAGNVAPGSSLRVAAPPPPAGTPHAAATTIPAWLVPTASGTVSMQMLTPGATGPASGFAADVDMLRLGHARMTLNDDLLGLAPDGVRTVTVTLRDGSRVELPVVENVFGAEFDQSVASVRLGADQN